MRRHERYEQPYVLNPLYGADQLDYLFRALPVHVLMGKIDTIQEPASMLLPRQRVAWKSGRDIESPQKLFSGTR